MRLGYALALLLLAPAALAQPVRVRALTSGHVGLTDGTSERFRGGDSLTVRALNGSIAHVVAPSGRAGTTMASALAIPEGRVGWLQEAASAVIREDEAAAAALRAEARRREEEEMRRLPPLVIDELLPSGPNSADGVDVLFRYYFRNPRRTIKYLRLALRPYNPVGDAVVSSIRGEGLRTVSITGPVEPETGPQFARWETVWYNPTITCVKIERVEVEYMDGSRATYVRDLPSILAEGFVNGCSFEQQRRRFGG